MSKRKKKRARQVFEVCQSMHNPSLSVRLFTATIFPPHGFSRRYLHHLGCTPASRRRKKFLKRKRFCRRTISRVRGTRHVTFFFSDVGNIRRKSIGPLKGDFPRDKAMPIFIFGSQTRTCKSRQQFFDSNDLLARFERYFLGTDLSKHCEILPSCFVLVV